MPMTLQSIPYVGRYTWATLQTACPPASTPVGATAQVSDIGPTTVHVTNSGTYWRVMAPTDVYFNSTTVTGDLTGADQILKQALLPLKLIRAGRFFSVQSSFGKNGTTDAATANRIRMGSAGTVADGILIGSLAALTAGVRSLAKQYFFELTSATEVGIISNQNQAAATYSNVSTATTFQTLLTIPDVDANAIYISQSIDMAGTTDAPQGFHLSVRIHP